ncbi:MAG: membrane protein insertase YidC [Candidatus Omnitrophica bacterium]|nr:membrane protein insertase YidC [Candidatus Omnitrophota bacterium]
MKKDANFLLAIAGTLLILIVYPLIMKQFFPQYFAPPQQTRQEDRARAPVDEHSQPSIQPARPETTTYSSTNSYVLTSNQYQVVVNEPAADIASIALLQILEPATQQPTLLMHTDNKSPGIFNLDILEGILPQSSEVLPDEARFIYQLKTQLTVEKRVMLNEGDYGLVLELIINNPTAQEQKLHYKLIGATGITSSGGISNRYMEQTTLLENKKIIKKNMGSIKGEASTPGDIKIVGFTTRYFALAAEPLFKADYAYNYKADALDTSFRSVIAGIGVSELVIPANGQVTQRIIVYAGPATHKDMSRLNLGFEDLRGKGVFAGLSELLLMLLRALHNIFRNYGLAVIALSIIINLFLYPLTMKSLKSMKELQAVQPEVEELRARYKDPKDAQKLNREIMELYKKHKTNPAGGCLPMLLQMPVFFALYGALMKSIELRGAGFLWIKDLSAPDALFMVQALNKMPLLGSLTQGNINLLPFLMIVASFYQQKMTTSQGKMSEQQKTMAIFMPIMLGAIFYNFPAGLVLYFLTNTLFSCGIQMRITKSLQR